MIIAVTVLLFVVWKTWELAQSDPVAFKALSKDEKELGLKDLPAGLIVLLVVTFIVAFLGELRVFSFNPFIEIVLTALVVLLLVYYFFQKRKLRKNMKNAPCWLSSFTQFRESSLYLTRYPRVPLRATRNIRGNSGFTLNSSIIGYISSVMTSLISFGAMLSACSVVMKAM